jgi:hypothetical protein
MVFRYMFGSWNPNKYHHLHELSLGRLALLVLATAACSILLFILLLIPAIFQADEAVAHLSTTTNITLGATMTQTAPTYLVQNPDVLVTTGEGNAFITITPQHIAIKRFLFFGTQEYPWTQFQSLNTLPISSMLGTLVLFLLPSMLAWGTFTLLVIAAVTAILYTLLAYFILHTRNFHIKYIDLLKVALYAGLPSMMLFAVTPILRLGLPLTIILGFQFVLWLVLAMLGTALFAEKHTSKFGVKGHS